MLVQQWSGHTEGRSLKVIDLATAKTLASYNLPEEYQFEGGTIATGHFLFPTYGSNGVTYVHGTAGNTGEDPPRCLWEWNLVTDKKRQLHHPGRDACYTSRDGSTLVEQVRFPLSPFQALFPGSILGTITSEMIVNRWFSFDPAPNIGIAYWHFWSLPEKTKRCTIIVPTYFQQMSHNLSNDGRWLILYDDFVDSDEGDPEQASDPSKVRTPAAPPPSPKTIKVYDTHTGKLWCEIPAPPEFHEHKPFLSSGFSSIYPVPRDQEESNGANGRKKPEPRATRRFRHSLSSSTMVQRDNNYRYFHIPSKTWLDFEDESTWFREVPSGSDGITQWLHTSPHAHFKIVTTDQQGKTRSSLVVDNKIGGYDPKLIPYSTQMVMERHAESRIPEWLLEHLRQYDKLSNWLQIQQQGREILVYDFQKQKPLWRKEMTGEQLVHTTVTPTGSYLIVAQMIGDHNEVTVLALPVTDWSPWWARSTGLLITLAMLWFCLQRKRPPVASALGISK